MEYGRILTKLESLNTWTVEELPLKSVILPQKEYRKKLNLEQVKSYKDWTLPRGLVVAENSGYRVIDGYHRTQAAKNQELEVAFFVVGKL